MTMRPASRGKKMEEKISKFERKDDRVIMERYLVALGSSKEDLKLSLLATSNITSAGKHL